MTVSLTNLVHYHKLDETTGNRLDSHSTCHLTPYNTPGYGTGILGNAVGLTRGSNHYLEYNWGASVPYSVDNMTLTCWCYPLESGYSTSLLCIRGATSGNYIIKFEKLFGATPYFRMGLRTTAPETVTFYCQNKPIPNGKWSFLAFRWKKNSPGSYTANSWIGTDGTLYKSADVNKSNALLTYYSSYSSFCIGLNPNNPTNQCSELLDESAVFNEALTDDVIAELYNSGLGLAYPFSSQQPIFPRLMTGGNLNNWKTVLQTGGNL